MTVRRMGVAGLALVLVVFAIAVVGRIALRDEPQGVDRTRRALLDDKRFSSGPRAGTTFADASTWLLEDGERCSERRGDDDPRCDARLSAAAYASVTAFVVADCTAPGVYRARTAMLSYVEAIQAFDGAALGTMPAPATPEVPTCEER